MKVLVFGKTGQVARALASLVPEAQFLGRAEADLTDPETCARMVRESGAEAVINAAAYTAVDMAEVEVDVADIVNGEAPIAMAKAAAEMGIPFVHISTDYVFSGIGNMPWKPEDTVSPQGAYGRSKLKGEAGVQAVGGVYGILRTSWVVSAYGQNFVKTMLRLAGTHDRLTVVSDQIGGPTPAMDVASAALAMARKLAANGAPSGIYHFSGTPDVSWSDFAREIFSQAGLAVEVVDIPTSEYRTPATRPLNSRLDCRSLERDFSVVRPNWRAGLKDILNALKEQSK